MVPPVPEVGLDRELELVMLSDLRLAALRLVAAPVSTVVAIGCLALGLAAAITVYSVIAQVVLRPSSIANADEVRLLQLELRAGAQAQRLSNWSYPAFEALRDALAPDFKGHCGDPRSALADTGDRRRCRAH